MEEKDLREKLERIFRVSDCSDELFDAFNLAVKNKIEDSELYKILLGNPALTKDEILMYTETLTQEFPNSSYELFIWTAGLFENNTFDYFSIDKSLHYYKKALDSNPVSHKPLINALKLYNYEIGLPTNSSIIDFIKENIQRIKDKKEVYLSLVGHYQKVGSLELKRKYQALAEKAQRDEDQ
jgi:hypothetical protein